MSAFFELARDSIERMVNPAYGPSVNEESAMRMARLLESGDLEERFRREAEDLRSLDSLTSHGWLWLLGWARARHLRLNDDLLFALYDQWSSVFVKAEILTVAIQDVESDFDGELPPFLDRLLSQVTRSPDEGLDTREAEATLTALLQAGHPITISAAARLLRVRWPGRGRLLRHLRSIADSVDEETRSIWFERLGLPERPPEEG